MCYAEPLELLVPAALGQLQNLRSLELADLRPCVLEAGCLDLPNLLSLVSGAAIFMMQRGCQGPPLCAASRASSSWAVQGRNFHSLCTFLTWCHGYEQA